nr:MAG TPA: hypothetical protein [Bacteriophage sp.]
MTTGLSSTAKRSPRRSATFTSTGSDFTALRNRRLSRCAAFRGTRNMR